MSRQDYRKIATALYSRRHNMGIEWGARVKFIADILEECERGFDRSKFLKACGYVK